MSPWPCTGMIDCIFQHFPSHMLFSPVILTLLPERSGSVFLPQLVTTADVTLFIWPPPPKPGHRRQYSFFHQVLLGCLFLESRHHCVRKLKLPWSKAPVEGTDSFHQLASHVSSCIGRTHFSESHHFSGTPVASQRSHPSGHCMEQGWVVPAEPYSCWAN